MAVDNAIHIANISMIKTFAYTVFHFKKKRTEFHIHMSEKLVYSLVFAFINTSKVPRMAQQSKLKANMVTK